MDSASGGEVWNAGVGAAFVATSVWPAANRAIIWPFLLNDWFTFSEAGWENGATVSGHVDIGVYDKNLAKIVTNGGAVQAGTSAFQSVAMTATTLAPDYYWLAMVMDNVTSTLRAAPPGATLSRLMGLQQMASAYPLPATITLANPASALLPFAVLGGLGSVL